MRIAVLILAAGLTALVLIPARGATAQQTGLPADLLERFALATDREEVLARLVPGTPDWRFCRVLLYQHEGRLREAAEELDAWEGRGDHDARLPLLRNRQTLLDFERDPAATYADLRRQFNLRHDHRRETADDLAALPTRLDPARSASATVIAEALQRAPGTVNGVTLAGLAVLDADRLDPAQRLSLLARLQAPDRDGLAALVVDGLRRYPERPFGSLPIHRRLLLAQLEECLRLMPELLNEQEFVRTWLERLVPGADTDVTLDAAARQAWLETLESFVMRLPARHNSLKANVLYHRLRHEHELGRVDRERLLAYLRLPRATPLRGANWRDRHPAAERVDAEQHFPTGLPAVGSDDPLIEACLIELFRHADLRAEFAPYLRRPELDRIFAESRLLHGIGDPAQWYPLLGNAEAVEAFRTRVELIFPAASPREFAPGAAVALEVQCKRVDALLVRVFEIDTFNAYVKTGREIAADIDLDGLVANEETRHVFSESPLRRVTRRFEFPSLSRPGVYVIEFVAEGLASRAVIHKGRLRQIERVGSAGHVFTVLDEAGRVLPQASLWMAGNEYTAGAHGEIAVPFASSTVSRPIVLRHGGRATLERFQHLEEKYELAAAVHVDREALLPGTMATLLLRPRLSVAGQPALLSLLEEPVLTLSATDRDGTETTREWRELQLAEDAETALSFRVPERLASLSVKLHARVASLSLGEPVSLLAAAPPIQVADSALTDAVDMLLPLLTPEGYVLELRGRSGEPLPDRRATLRLHHRHVVEPIHVELRTDASGRIALGPLTDILRVTSGDLPSGGLDWQPHPGGQPGWPAHLAGRVGQTLRLAAPEELSAITRQDLSLLELRGGGPAPVPVPLELTSASSSLLPAMPAVDRFANVRLRDGVLEIAGLPAGRHELVLKRHGVTVQIEVSDGELVAGWIVGPHRMLPAGPATPPLVTRLAAEDATLVIRVEGALPSTRVHLLASRHEPPWGLGQMLHLTDAAAPREVRPPAAWTVYQQHRELSAEARYVLDRRHLRKFPGSLIARPTLLLNPWVLEPTVWDMVGLGAGGMAGGQGGGGGGSKQAWRGMSHREEDGLAGHPLRRADLDFLPEASVTLANLRPDAEGRIVVPFARLGGNRHVQVAALDDRGIATARLVLPAVPLVPQDVTLASAFPTDRPLAETRSIEFLPAGGTLLVPNAADAELAELGTLADVHRLFTALTAHPDLLHFAELLRWPSLSREQKLQRLSDDGCHELHLFVHEHDPELFAEVVRPHLAHKLHKTFLDLWLLGEDLSAFTEPWRFAQLNTAERALLARRLPELAPMLEQLLKEAGELTPPDPVLQRRRFEAALRGEALHEQLAAGVPASEPVSFDSEPGRAEHGEESGISAEIAEQLRSLGYLGGGSSGAAAAPGPGALTGRGRRDAQLRESVRPLVRDVEPTRMVVEHDFWHQRSFESGPALVPPSDFWLEFVRTPADQPFVSVHVGQAARGINEMLLALALLDLPFEAESPERVADGDGLRLSATSPLLVVRRQIEATEPAEADSPVFVGQDLFRLDRRTVRVGAELRERPVRDEFLTGVPYLSRVVVSNGGSAEQRVTLLVQVPEGAVPLRGGRTTTSTELVLPPYAATTVESVFYFPRPGDFAHWPASVSREGRVLASATPAIRRAVLQLSQPDTESWEDVARDADEAELWAFLDRTNPRTIRLDRMAWRLSDAGFFRRAVERLRARGVYDQVIWSYALLHGDAAATREYLEFNEDFVVASGPVLDSPLLSIDPVERRLYEHVEFDPLIHARAHPWGGQREIRDQGLAGQFERFLTVLAFRPQLDDQDWLSVAYYLLLSDRIEEGQAAFARVDAARLPGRLHHALMEAWLDALGPDPARALAIAQAGRDHPLPRWRARYRELLTLLGAGGGAEANGGAAGARSDLESEPSLELTARDGGLVLEHARLSRAELRIFRMDAEMLFSRDPFGAQDADLFALVRPAHVVELVLDPAGGSRVLELPAELRAGNVLVEVRSGGLVRRQVHHAGRLSVTVHETLGQLVVRAAGDGEPLPAVYVKVYARLPGGAVRFHRDGYTDPRGRFDYASVSGTTDTPERFALLVLSEMEGAVTREVAVPPR